MFECYTQAARATIFGARYLASQTGSSEIETQHLLLGLLRTDKTLANRFLSSPWAAELVWKKVEQRTPIRTRVQGLTEIPLDKASKRVLHFALEEADRASSKRVHTSHLLLALLEVREGMAGEILSELGVLSAHVREELSRIPHDDSKQEQFDRASDLLPEGVFELRTRIESVRARLNDAIAEHDFEKARAISDEEGTLHDQLVAIYRRVGLTGWIYE